MNAKIREHVAAYNAANGFETTDEEIIATIREADRVWRGDESERRWWTDCLTVVEVDGMLIGFGDAITTGDDSPRDVGWEFDPSTICEVVAKEVVTTVYEPVT
jgi:hypothetical protein